jgi:hypothetical protein
LPPEPLKDLPACACKIAVIFTLRSIDHGANRNRNA